MSAETPWRDQPKRSAIVVLCWLLFGVVCQAQLAGQQPGDIAYGSARRLCTLASQRVDESSGLACSRRHPGAFWTHNDSGDEARLYAFDSTGRDLGCCRLANVTAFDFEDLASFRYRQRSWLLVGDVGNNGCAVEVQILYLVEEPQLDPSRPSAADVSVAQVIHFAYEDDHRDCEALAVDPTDRTILLISKQRTAPCYVYSLAWPEDDPQRVFTARKIGTLPLPPVTAMDISPDGLRAVVASYGDAYQYTRKLGQSWAVAFSQPARRIALPRRTQGESICYGPDGKSLYLTSESRPTPLWVVPVRDHLLPPPAALRIHPEAFWIPLPPIQAQGAGLTGTSPW